MSLGEQPIRATLAISKAEALTGTNRTLNLPGGQQVRVFVPAGAYDGQIIRLEDQGELTTGSPTSTVILTLAVAQGEDANWPSNIGSDEQTARASRPNPQGIAGFPQGMPLYPPQQPPVFVPPSYPPYQGMPAFTPTSSSNIAPRPPHSHGKIILLIVLVLLIIVSGVGLFSLIQANQGVTTNPATTLNATGTTEVNATATAHAVTATAQPNATASAIAAATATIVAQNPDPYRPNNGILALYDPLSQPSQWSNASDSTFGGTCQFSNGAYHISQSKPHSLFPCIDSNSNFSNFAFEVQMTIMKGECGGIVFRNDAATSKDYIFSVCQDGSYKLFLYMDNTHSNTLTSNSSSAIHTGLNHSNVIAVVANGSTLDLYVNNQKIYSRSDSTYSHGQIGFIADASNNPTEVVYSNAKVWTL